MPIGLFSRPGFFHGNEKTTPLKKYPDTKKIKIRVKRKGEPGRVTQAGFVHKHQRTDPVSL
jgi:hypothetical protein